MLGNFAQRFCALSLDKKIGNLLIYLVSHIVFYFSKTVLFFFSLEKCVSGVY